MGWLDKPVTDKEIRDFRAGKPVRAKVAEEAAFRRSGGKKSAAAIRRNIKKNVNRRGVSQDDLDAL